MGQMCGSLFHASSAQYLVSFQFDWDLIAKEAKVRNDQELTRLEESKPLDNKLI